MGGSHNVMPIVSKIFCSTSPTILMVRKRPHVINGGGFVVTNCSQNLVFMVDGCGTLGVKGELMLKDGDGEPILFIRKKGGIIQALSTRDKWNGYLMDNEGANKLIFSLTDPKSCLPKKKANRIYVDPKGHNKDWDFEVNGSFVDKDCTISDCRGNIVAKVGMKDMMGSKDFYHVVVQPGYDQAFVVGVIAILDNIHGESTRC